MKSKELSRASVRISKKLPFLMTISSPDLVLKIRLKKSQALLIASMVEREQELIDE